MLRQVIRTGCTAACIGLLMQAAAWGEEQPQRYTVPANCIHAERGNCFVASMDFGEPGDKTTGNRSLIVLYEDGRPMGPARSAHAAIREEGRGRYSFWTRESLYFSTTDNTDPRTNGRRYEVASKNPRSALGGLTRFPARRREHVEEVSRGNYEYAVSVGGTLDMENSRTLTSNNCYITFQNNLALTVENTGNVLVRNPRLVINDRGNWYTFESLLEEFMRGAMDDQQRALFIWQNMRDNLYHEHPLFGNAEPHDPVKLFNVYGFNLCDDAGNAGCSLFYHAGMRGSKNRSLHGHVQCEAFVNGKHQFLDVDMDCFYLDRENEFPVSGDACARDHDLVRRELNYGPVVSRFTSSEAPAALFGADDRQHDARHRGHEMAYDLRPGEKVVFRWDNLGKFCAEHPDQAKRPKYFGNSKFVYQPRLTPADLRRDASATRNVGPATLADQGGLLAGLADDAFLDYEIRMPYPACGGAVTAECVGGAGEDRFSLAVSLDGNTWQTAAQRGGPGKHCLEADLEEALDVLNNPPKYRYFVRVGLGSADRQHSANLCSLKIETDVLAAPASLPRLVCGDNRVVYQDETAEPHRVRITHQWQESDAVQPLPPVSVPDFPRPDAQIRESLIAFKWAPVPQAQRYHLQVSRRPDFKVPYRPSLDVVIPTTNWCVPYTGIFSPDTTYYWRLRTCDHWGVWGNWSPVWRFTWHGPRVPLNLGITRDEGTVRLTWAPNPRGERPVAYDVYGSDQKGFSVHKAVHDVPGLGKSPANFLGRTEETSLEVVSAKATSDSANRVFYRVVAIDAAGTESGCSDYVELPHPLIYSQPPLTATVGVPYRYAVRSLRSQGDYQCRQDPDAKKKQYAYRFWDVEVNQYRLVAGPPWMTVDVDKGMLSGTPEARNLGTTRVRIEATNQFGDRAKQEFQLQVTE